MEKNRPPIRVTTGDRSLTYKDAIRVLGVVFDGRLSFFKHADHLREKAEVTVARLPHSPKCREVAYGLSRRPPCTVACSSLG
ncbi:hypothetical protein HPB50_028925 [Hyalomma asiaticum]|nr:hypothetical protein HPB50_028925 [Hyalomma asiaticum]